MANDEQLMTIGDLTGDEVVTLDPSATLVEVAVTMTRDDIGAVVLGTAADIHGIVSERDIVRAVAQADDLDVTPASAVASTRLIWADASSPVEDVADQMMQMWVRHVLVEQDGALVGIVSARDILGALTSVPSQAYGAAARLVK